MTSQDLKKLLASLKGTSKTLHFREEQPIVFLFDENHDNPNNSIGLNIQNAQKLIKDGKVEIIGVESLAGGTYWDSETRQYNPDSSLSRLYLETKHQYQNNCTKFLDGLKEYSEIITGVESVQMGACIEEEDSDDIVDFRTNPLHEERSKHFIKTLSQDYQSKGLKGNLILNSGLKHNDHIQKWIKSGEIGGFASLQFSYVRINTIR